MLLVRILALCQCLCDTFTEYNLILTNDVRVAVATSHGLTRESTSKVDVFGWVEVEGRRR